jgi:stage III sporulation protein AE
MNLLLNFSNTFLIPLISVYLIFVVGNTVFEQKLLSVLASFIRWGCKMLLTTATIAFTAYLNVAGLISSTGDIFAERITKTALSSALPVVGSILSDAASSLVAGAAIVRNSIGIFGLLSVAAILLFPFVNLGVRYLLFLAVSRLADLFPNHRFSSLLNGIAGAYGMLLGVIGSGMIMIFLTLISFMQIVGG